MKFNKRPKSIKEAFSLIEMLIVMSVIGLLLAMAAPDLFSLVQSSSLTGEGVNLRNRLTQAQQSALSLNSDVEVRFFKFSDRLDAEITDRYRGYQFFKFDKLGQMVPLSQMFRIKAPVTVNESLSTLLDSDAGYEESSFADDTRYSPAVGEFEIPIAGETLMADYIAFRFRADGSTDLPSRPSPDDVWYVTLVQGEGAADSSQVPDNYFTIQIDSFNGRLTEFRP